MKLKTVLTVVIASLLATLTLPAQNFTNAALSGLVQQVAAKLKAGDTTEAALAPELKKFDELLAAQKGGKTLAAAEVIYMKGMLYLQVFNDSDKGGELMRMLKADYAETKYGQSAAKILDQIAKQSSAKKVQSAITAGLPFPDFQEKDLDGKPLSVASRKGKVVLLDFWATWCGPCRAELPNVITAYKKYHDKGFEIIGVSLDSDRAKLDAFLKKTDGMTWPQYFDGEGWGNKIAVKYGVESIPFTVLIGKDGKIIGKDLRGDDLIAAVAKALGK
jgi:thiol-disulfide isomerase/thioredoxin